VIGPAEVTIDGSDVASHAFTLAGLRPRLAWAAACRSAPAGISRRDITAG
jgi:hypothetical protein